MLSAIQIQSHHFVEIGLSATTNLNEDEIKKRNVTCRHRLAWNPKDNDTTCWFARLRVELVHNENGTKSLYTGVMENTGVFRLHESVPPEIRHKFVAQNAGAILYSAIREWVATASARSLHGMIELPTIDARSFIPKEAPATPVEPKQIEPKQ